MPSGRSRYNEHELDSDIIVQQTSSEEFDPIDRGNNKQNYDEETGATWDDVVYVCCNRSGKGWIKLITYMILFFALLYFYFVGIVLLGTAAQVMGGCDAASLLSNFSNPITCVMAGVLATSIFQSQLATHIIIGSLVGNVLTVQQGIYIAMGANVGNTVINSIISLAYLSNNESLERAIAGASVNDIYYFLAILIMLPLEASSNMLYRLVEVILPSDLGNVNQFNGIVYASVLPVTNKMLIANEALISDLLSNEVETCNSNYPIVCEDGVQTYATCTTGLISCNEKNNDCPLFFEAGASMKTEQVKGAITFVIAAVMMLLCFFGMMALLNKLIMSIPVEVIAKVTNSNQYFSMLMGIGVSVLFGSSSITESALMPFIGAGIMELEQVFPWCLGSNIGMSLTTMLSSMYSGKKDHVHVALANVFFNVFSTIIWYPIAWMRRFPLHGALIVGIISREYMFFPFVYVALAFLVLPLVILGIVILMQNSNKGLVALGGIIVSLLIIFASYGIYWWFFLSGKESFLNYFDNEEDEDNNMPSDDEMSEGTEDSSRGAYDRQEFARSRSNKSNRSRSKRYDREQPKGILRNRSMDPTTLKRNISGIGPTPPGEMKPKYSRRRRSDQQIDSSPSMCCSDFQ